MKKEQLKNVSASATTRLSEVSHEEEKEETDLVSILYKLLLARPSLLVACCCLLPSRQKAHRPKERLRKGDRGGQNPIISSIQISTELYHNISQR